MAQVQRTIFSGLFTCQSVTGVLTDGLIAGLTDMIDGLYANRLRSTSGNFGGDGVPRSHL